MNRLRLLSSLVAIFLDAHGIYFDLLAKLARLPAEGETVRVDPLC